MSFTFTTRLPLSRHAVDRDHLSRSVPGLFDQLWADPATRVLPVWHGKMLLAPSDSTSAVHLTLLPPTSVVMSGQNPGLRV